MNETTTSRWIVSGRVQGVGFRWFVYQRAKELGLIGWTANRPDGKVEVVAQGSSQSLTILEAALRTGPSFAHVAHVEKCDFPHEVDRSKSFIIR